MPLSLDFDRSTLSSSYPSPISEIESEGSIKIPLPSKIAKEIGESILGEAFDKPLLYADPAFLDLTPPGALSTVKFALITVIANAVAAMLKHNYKVGYVKESEVRAFIYRLDKMTPIDSFKAPLRKDPIISGTKRKHGCEELPIEVEYVLPDGEVKMVMI